MSVVDMRRTTSSSTSSTRRGRPDASADGAASGGRAWDGVGAGADGRRVASTLRNRAISSSPR
jgi:hypothetical protein